MSFKEGDLHGKCEMYRRQLGGMTAANNRLKGRVKGLEELVDGLAKKVAWPIKEGKRMPPDFEELKSAMVELGVWKEPRDGK